MKIFGSGFVMESRPQDHEICPGVAWDDHAESVAMFLHGSDYSIEQGYEVMNSIKVNYGQL